MRSGSNLAARLLKVYKKSGLSKPEIAFWFGRSRVTTDRWFKGVTPRALWLDEVERRLSELEFLSKTKPIIPYEMTWDKRADFLKRLRHAALSRPNTRKPRA